jgi:hypothetical protein
LRKLSSKYMWVLAVESQEWTLKFRERRYSRTPTTSATGIKMNNKGAQVLGTIQQ